MKTLQVDEHRAWSSDALREWATEQGIQLVISPGQSHTRLAILERRHQVTRRAISIFLEANPGVADDKDGLIIALSYIVPQLNRTPNVQKDSHHCTGCWATHHMCLACFLRSPHCTIQHISTPLRSSWNNFDSDKKLRRPWSKPTQIIDFDEHCCESTWDNLYCFSPVTFATTGVTPRLDPQGSSSGEDLPLSSCENLDNMGLTPTPTGLGMELFFFEQRLSTSSLPRPSRTRQRNQGIHWIQPSKLWPTSDREEWHSTLTWARATNDDVKKLRRMRRRMTSTRRWATFLEINFHQIDGKFLMMVACGLASTATQDASSTCPRSL